VEWMLRDWRPGNGRKRKNTSEHDQTARKGKPVAFVNGIGEVAAMPAPLFAKNGSGSVVWKEGKKKSPVIHLVLY